MARRKHGTGLSADPDEARQQILAAAERVIMRYGVPKTTMDDIGKEAGVSRPTVYRYFGDRDALLGALIERRSRMLFGGPARSSSATTPSPNSWSRAWSISSTMADKDPIVRILVSPEHMELATPIVGGSIWPPNSPPKCGSPSCAAPSIAARSGQTWTCRRLRSGWRWFSSSWSAGSTSQGQTTPGTESC